METDIISKLVEETHEIFNAASIYEVIDLDKQAAIAELNNIDNTITESSSIDIGRFWRG